MNQTKFNEYIYTLSTLSHFHVNAPTKPPALEMEQIKHLRVLDAIALFLVTEPQHDVAAVTFKQSPHAITFYYSKNSPCNAALKAYIADTLTFLNVSRDEALFNIALGVVRRAVPNCVKKYRSRVSKLMKGFHDVLGVDPCNEDLISRIVLPTEESLTLSAKLTELFKILKMLPMADIALLKGMPLELVKASMICYRIGMLISFFFLAPWHRLMSCV